MAIMYVDAFIKLSFRISLKKRIVRKNISDKNYLILKKQKKTVTWK